MKFKLLIVVLLSTFTTLQSFAQNCASLNADGVFDQSDDILMTSYHQSLAKTTNGYAVWGESMAPNAANQGTITEILPANGYNYTGTPIQAAISGNDEGQAFLATTTNLYAWGASANGDGTGGYDAEVVSIDFVTGPSFAAMPNLPFSSANIKDLHASTNVLYVTLNNGTVWVATNNRPAVTGNANTDVTVWQQVQTSLGVPLTDVKQVTGNQRTGYALTNSGDIYAWGQNVELGNGPGVVTYDYATLMTALPGGVTPTYISSFMHLGDANNASGLLVLASDKKVYGVGRNTTGNIITSTTGNVSTWTSIKVAGGAELTDVLMLATSHTSEEWATAAVITTSDVAGDNPSNFKVVRAWGHNNLNSISWPNATSLIQDPTIPPTFDVGIDDPLAVSVGGHAITYFNSSNGGSICFSGHIIDGSVGGLSTVQEGFDCVVDPNIEFCAIAALTANNDTASAIQGTGGTDIINVLDNDTYEGNQATLANVTITQTSTTNPGVTIDTLTGGVDVGTGVPTGIYFIEYEICDVADLNNCASATVTVRVTPDTDNDGIPDGIDIDDDNDGIPDLTEVISEPYADEDGDGIFAFEDDDDNNDTIGDNDNAIEAGFDTDGDGIINSLDLDSDNDGITDVIEGGGDDPDNDGIVGTGAITDVDEDGLHDPVDDINSGGANEVSNGTGLPVTNSDNDSIPNFLDLDSDNDGIPDNIEAQTTSGYIAPSGVGAAMTDFNNNGVDDNYEDIPNGEAGLTPENSDGQDNPDYLDSDSDNDGISDVLEAGGTDPDNDGIIGTGTITDADGDGLDDSVDDIDSGKATGEVTGGTPLADGDFDNDGLNNRIDLDSDNDGITDVVETGNGALDTDNDGDVDINDTGFADTDNNGQSDNTQATVLVNSDGNTGDGVDYLDIDADDDGIPDNVEGQPTAGYIPPSGNDGNNNGIDDAYEGADFIDVPENTDSDIIPDYLDLDSDNDGASDLVEANQGTFTGTDTDGDGLDDGFDDSNDTGVSPDVNDNLNNGAIDTPDVGEPGTPEVDFREAEDNDNDGTPDVLDIDDDNDGIPDIVESSGNNPDGDEDGDGILNYLDTTDGGNAGDGSPTDYTDADNNGIPDVYDTDGDGVPNHFDLDSDNDGITDVRESRGALATDPDPDNDGIIGTGAITDVDGDGLDDDYDNIDSGNQSGAGEVTNGDPLVVPNNDGDTLPDFLDIDADNDGIPDNIEGQPTLVANGYVAPSGVGAGINDTNGNGVDDNYEDIPGGTVGYTPFNFDNVDTPDYIDSDADNDGTPDIEENGNANDTLAGTDVDGDGLDDNFDDNNDSAIAGSTVNDDHNPPSAANLGDQDGDINDPGGDVDYRDALDTDGDGIPNFTDIDDDNDGILDVDECDPEVFAAGAIPTLEGDAITLDVGVGNQQRILTQDDDGAEFDNTADVLVVAFGATLPVGTKVVIRMANENFGDAPLAAMVIQQATTANGSDASNPLTIDGIEDAYENYSYTISGSEATHLRISMSVDDGKKVLVDHVSWLDSHICITDGDTDGDGIINSLDLDSDNDGIPDIIEAQTTLGYVAPLGIDSDFDGLDDAFDATPNGDSNGAGSIGLNAIDTDGDNIPDYVDEDADGDGIFDVEESANPTLPNDGNGHLTGVFGDNGLLAALESADDYSDVNGIFDDTQGDNFTDADNNAFSGGNVDFRETADFDGDGVPDVDDIDDDNDGIPDLVETGGTDPLEDLDLDGVPAYLDDDDNDLNVGNDDNATQPAFDTDGDGRPNHLDLDSDNDGITDIRENGGIDNNRDGEVDYPTPGDASTMVDVDGDGLDDELDNVDSESGNGEVTNGTPLTIADNDSDTIPDYHDIDADDDGIPDNVEAQTTDGWVAPSGVGTGITDSNNNGVDDVYENLTSGIVGVTPVNFDGVDNPDYLDLDSDNDDIPDIEENGNANDTLAGTDTDGDGLDDNFDDNNDSAIAGSTVNDDHNPPSGANLGDEDADIGLGGDADYRDAPDTDGDGIIDPIDIDDDNDGILDVNECDLIFTAGAIPTVEGDAITLDAGVGNQQRILTQDDDGAEFDSVDDVLVVSFGTTLTPGSTVTLRMQNDGVGSTNEIQVQQTTAGDGTGASNPLTFSGITDAWVDYTYTILGTDATHLRISMPVDGGQKTDVDHVTWNRLDCDANGDTDGDGIPNSLDLDSDNDGIPDNIEAQSTLGYVAATPFAPTGFDDDGDGLDNAYDTTPNGDPNGAGSIGLVAVDTDGDGFPDFTDLDADGDAIFDVVESGSGLPNDGNGEVTGVVGENGLVDALETSDDYADVNGTFDDTQADNFTDGDNDVNAPGGDVDYRDDTVTPDTDGDGVLDSVDLDDDNDGVSDAVEGFVGCPSTDVSINNIANVTTQVPLDTGVLSTVYPRLFDGIYDGNNGSTSEDQVMKFNDVTLSSIGANAEIFKFEFIDPVSLEQIVLDTKDDQPFFNEATSTFRIEGSQNNTTWTDLSGQLTGSGADGGETINFTNTTAYKYYRILWTGPAGNKLAQQWLEEVRFATASCTPVEVDSDGDGTPDHLDSDSDNDGIADVIEAGGTDTNNDGYIDVAGVFTDVDGDGFQDTVDNEDGGNQSGAGEVNNPGTQLPDTNSDGDSFSNRIDIDADDDGIVDVIESQPTVGYIAPTGLDTDGDGIDDAFDPDQGGSFTNVLEDTDGDTTPDYLDLDSDGDGESDTIEAYDTNGDGVADTVPANADADNDGLDDNFDNFDLGTDTGNANGDNVNQEATFPFPVTIDSFFGEDADWRLVEYIQTTDGDWNVPANWSNDLVPGQEDNAIIDADVASYLTTDQPVNNLLLRSGSTVSIPDGAITLTVVGDIENNGDFTLYEANLDGNDGNVPQGTDGIPNTDGEVLLNGPTTQTLSGTGNYYNLRVDNANGVDVNNPTTSGDPTEIQGILYVDNGVFTTDDNVLIPCFFVSVGSLGPLDHPYANGRAGQIGPILAGGSISGEVQVEQCYPGRRAYRYVASSVNTTTSIHDNWQENATSYNDMLNAPSILQNDGSPYSLGTHITGVTHGSGNALGQEILDGTNGLDWQPSGIASMFEFNETNQDFDPVLVTESGAPESATLNVGKAYAMIIRGSRQVDLTINGSPTSNTKLRSKGTVVKGHTFTTTNINNGDFMFLGNPFHSIVDMRKVVYGDLINVNDDSNGLGRYVYAYDPTLGGNLNDINENSGVGALEGDRGAYVTIDLHEVFGPTDTDTGSGSTTEMSHFLQAYQGFFMQAIADNPTMVFEESDKAVGEEQIDVFSSSPANMVSIRLFDQVSYNSNGTSDDYMAINFTLNDNNAVDYDDAIKFSNSDENIGRLEAGTYLTYESRDMPQDGDILELYTFNYRAPDYAMVVKVDGLLDNTVYLHDNYTNTDTVLNNDLSTLVNFNVDPANPASTDPYRFELRFETSTLGATEFDLEGISVYPNPASDILNVNLGDNTGRFESLELFDITGRLIATRDLSNNVLDIQMNVNGLSSGVYVLKVSSGTEQFSTKVIIE